MNGLPQVVKNQAFLPVLTLLAHFARAALLALALLSSGVILAALATPPFLPPLLPIARIKRKISALVNSWPSVSEVERLTISNAA